MSYDNSLRREIDARYASIRRENNAKNEVLKRKLYSDELFADTLNSYRGEKFEYSKAKYRGDDEETKKRLNSARKLKNKLYEISKSLGVDADDLRPVYTCEECKDTGFTPDGKRCQCYNRIIKSLVFDLLGISEPELPSFADSTLEDKNGLDKIYEKIKLYCEKFNGKNDKNLVVSGDVGTGKSFLVGAICNEIEKRGFDALFISAQNLNNVFLKYHTAPIDEKSLYASILIDCDLLAIDDLGCEPPLRNVTNEYLLMILTERAARNSATIITTNLTQNQLLDKYGERILSRLNDKHRGIFLRVVGEDLRRLK